MLINGLEIRVVDQGSSDVPMFLVHGYTGGASDFDDVAPSLAQTRRVIRYDHRGHAQSENTGKSEDYTFDLLVADLTALVDAMGFEQIDLLGHSMGGIVAMRYTIDNPAKVRSLVLMDTGAEPAGAMPLDIIDMLAERGRNEGMQVVVEVMAPFVGALQERLTEERRQELADRYNQKMPFMDPIAFQRFARELNDYPSMVGELKTISCPTLVMVGENDAGLRAAAETMAKEIPGAELVVIADAGHSPQEDRPDEWLRVVEQHLSGV
jgi:pimeloyl-ACP methyl ester carboxylesterase